VQYLKNRTKKSYGSYALYIYSLRSIYLQSFMLISSIILELCPGQDFSKRGDNSELWFFCTALSPNEIYLPTKFRVDISYNYVPDKIQSVKINKGR
jgi:hypothetical protein